MRSQRRDYRPAIAAPFRWRDWAADPNGPTGEALLEFVNGELLPYLRGLSGTGATIPETCSRRSSGRQTTGCSPAIYCATSSTRSTKSTSPRLTTSTRWPTCTSRCCARCAMPPATPASSTRLDPSSASSSSRSTRGSARSSSTPPAVPADSSSRRSSTSAAAGQDRAAASHATNNLRGIEKKPLPYLLGMMNLVLHGVGQPNIVRGNALARPITQISKRDRVDVILTTRPSAAKRRRASRRTSRPTSRPLRRRGCSFSS